MARPTPSMDDEGTRTAVELRAEEYGDLGIPPSQARAVAMRDMGFTNKQVADELDVGEGAASSYYSKFNDKAENALKLVLTTLGGETTIIAEQEWDLYNLVNKKFITVSLDPGFGKEPVEAYTDSKKTPSEGRITVIHVKSGGPSGEPVGTVDISSETYKSLDELADAVYRDQDLHHDTASLWYKLLGKAGGDDLQATLEHPSDKIPFAHPDHPEFDSHVMQIEERKRGADDMRDQW